MTLLWTIYCADRIVVIENGRIREMGSHAELLRLRGKYYRLYTQQFHLEQVHKYAEPLESLTASLKAN